MDYLKIDLVKSFMQFEGNLEIKGTCYNYDKKGGLCFSGISKTKKDEGIIRPVKITMDKYQIEEINDCTTVEEVYGCYKKMGYF